MENYQSLKAKTNVILLSSLFLLITKKKKNKRQTRRFWVRDIFKRRKMQGAYHHLLQEMRLTDSDKYFNYLRMSSDNFNKLLHIVGPKLTREYCVREPISAGERLAATLRYLASGDSMISISYAFRIGTSTLSNIISETCNVIWDCLHKTVLLTPSATSWIKISQDFNQKWQLPNCVGALDGKHVVIQAPPKCGSTFFNYKGSHSVVLLALCDANYRFTLVDCGAEGRHSDGGIFKNSSIGKLLSSEDNLYLPPPSPIEYEGDPLNYYIAADEAFPLTSNIMRHYPGRYLTKDKRIFNYRLSRGRRVIENTFGILASRWRIYRKPIIASLHTVDGIIKATVCLHNWLMMYESNMKNEQKQYCPSNFLDRENGDGEIIYGEWHNENNISNLQDINRISSNMHGRHAFSMREQLKCYFQFDGAIDFQWNK